MVTEEHAPGYVPNPNYTQEDWVEVSDNPELTDEQLARAKPLAETRPDLVEALRRRGRPLSASTKALFSIRIDRDVLEAYRTSGPGWQSRMNEILRKGAGM